MMKDTALSLAQTLIGVVVYFLCVDIGVHAMPIHPILFVFGIFMCLFGFAFVLASFYFAINRIQEARKVKAKMQRIQNRRNIS